MNQKQVVKAADRYLAASAAYTEATRLPLEEYRKVSLAYYNEIYKINLLDDRMRIWRHIELKQAWADARRYQ